MQIALAARFVSVTTWRDKGIGTERPLPKRDVLRGDGVRVALRYVTFRLEYLTRDECPRTGPYICQSLCARYPAHGSGSRRRWIVLDHMKALNYLAGAFSNGPAHRRTDDRQAKNCGVLPIHRGQALGFAFVVPFRRDQVRAFSNCAQTSSSVSMSKPGARAGPKTMASQEITVSMACFSDGMTSVGMTNAP